MNGRDTAPRDRARARIPKGDGESPFVPLTAVHTLPGSAHDMIVFIGCRRVRKDWILTTCATKRPLYAGQCERAKPRPGHYRKNDEAPSKTQLFVICLLDGAAAPSFEGCAIRRASTQFSADSERVFWFSCASSAAMRYNVCRERILGEGTQAGNLAVSEGKQDDKYWRTVSSARQRVLAKAWLWQAVERRKRGLSVRRSGDGDRAIGVRSMRRDAGPGIEGRRFENLHRFL